MKLRIGTRKSALALWQAERVQGWLRDRGEECELVPMSTEGDRITDRPLAEVGGKGLFVKELEQALQEGRADLAVHSAKDVPFALPQGFALSARVGTSSLRRAVQLLAVRPDLVIVPVRGNVHTRLARATGARVLRGGVEVRPADGDPQGPLDAVVLALAGLRRLGREEAVGAALDPTVFVPAPGQGLLALETRADDEAAALVAPLADATAHARLAAERGVVEALDASCNTPVGAYARTTGDRIDVCAYAGLPDGTEWITDRLTGAAGDARALGAEVARRMLAAGAGELLGRLGSAGERG
jgi:hydroxymethylbilane synthase